MPNARSQSRRHAARCCKPSGASAAGARGRWSQDERDFPVWGWNVGIGVADLARDLGRMPGAVREHAWLAGLKPRGRMHMPRSLPRPRLMRDYMRTIGVST
jgi:hypothetical protein